MDMVGIHFEALTGETTIIQRKRAYSALEQAMERHGVKITYYAMSSLDQKRGHYKKYGGSWHKKRLQKGFGGIDSLGFCANPANSNAPAYDWTATANFGWTLKTKLTVLLPIENCDLEGPEYRETLEAFSALADWDYGWVAIGDRNKGIAPYTSGDYNDGRLAKEETERVDLWYVSSYQDTEKRLTHLRDVFLNNFITDSHLEFPLFGKTLKDFIRKDQSSTLSPLSNGVWLWKIKAKSLSKIREKIVPSGLLLSRPKENSKPSLFKRFNIF